MHVVDKEKKLICYSGIFLGTLFTKHRGFSKINNFTVYEHTAKSYLLGRHMVQKLGGN
jgi:hypothetical protein